MDAAMARRVLRLLFGVTVRDGSLTNEEIDFMDRARAKLGLTDDRDAWLMPIADPAAAAEELAAMPAQAQKEALALLIDAAAVDGVVHESERRFLEASAEVLGITSEQLEERIVEALSGD